MYFWYRFFTYLFYPFAPVYLFFRKIRKKEDPLIYKEKLSKINLPSGLSYTDIKSGNYSKGGRVASNPNPYEPRAI